MADKRKSAAIINSGSDSDSDVSDSEFQVNFELQALILLTDGLICIPSFPALGQETEKCPLKVCQPVASIASKKVPV